MSGYDNLQGFGTFLNAVPEPIYDIAREKFVQDSVKEIMEKMDDEKEKERREEERRRYAEERIAKAKQMIRDGAGIAREGPTVYLKSSAYFGATRKVWYLHNQGGAWVDPYSPYSLGDEGEREYNAVTFSDQRVRYHGQGFGPMSAWKRDQLDAKFLCLEKLTLQQIEESGAEDAILNELDLWL